MWCWKSSWTSRWLVVHALEFAHSNWNHASAESAETKSNALSKLSTKHKVHQNSNAASRAAGTEECYSRQGDQSVSLSDTPASAESSKAALFNCHALCFVCFFVKFWERSSSYISSSRLAIRTFLYPFAPTRTFWTRTLVKVTHVLRKQNMKS